MEAQIMHWNTRYGSIEKCLDKPDGIAILSYLMQVRIRCHNCFRRFTYTILYFTMMREHFK